MTVHINPLPDEPDMTWADIDRVRAEITGYIRQRFPVSDPEEIADQAVSHVLIQAQRPGRVRHFRAVVFRQAIRTARAEQRRQARLAPGDPAVILALAVQDEATQPAPLTTLLAQEQSHILRCALRELHPTLRRTLLASMAGRKLVQIAQVENVHVNTVAKRKKAALKQLRSLLASYYPDLFTNDSLPKP